MNNLILSNKKTMSSLEIAELAGRNHKDVMRSIRDMEPAWEKINGRNFALVEYRDSKGEMRPCYELDYKECMYVAAKFNDETRAKLVLRWDALETGKATPAYQVPSSFSEALMLAAQQQLQIEEQQKQISCMSTEIVEMKKKTDYLEIILSSRGTVVTTQIAQDYGMSAKAFNRLLADKGIQRKVNGQWILYAPYMSSGYVHSKSVNITHKDGRPDVKMNTEWTQRGRLFIYETLKKCDILPLIERSIINSAS
ncbi:phage regulatory protein/antirepressor Ant [Bacteroides finegoldii]|mgnify:CR=1 FL=1|uniref:phage regulatory protein/antirepressor Ant n=1 Tax=Bacteroides finegoldii TaxID=338188 RepID=UPI001E556072|nr:phage regulatory protein/antirepressor Ant [Bacteroides finegoldii]DAN19963.1 MAG TPA: antirepressor protein [Caudoviricetes sp.]